MEDYKNIKDEEYYSELQASIRSYDSKLWMMPGLFFVVVSLIIGNLDSNNILSPKNAIISLFGSLFLLILILLYTKAHIFHISIQKKINEFDNIYKKDDKKIKRIPLTSMTNIEFNKRINELERKQLEDNQGNEGARFSCFQIFLARLRVSSWIRNIMLGVFILSSLFSILCFIHWINLIF